MAEEIPPPFVAPLLSSNLKYGSTSIAWHVPAEDSSRHKKSLAISSKKKKKKKTTFQDIEAEKSNPKIRNPNSEKCIKWPNASDEETCSPPESPASFRTIKPYLRKKDPYSLNISPSDNENEEDIVVQTPLSKFLSIFRLSCLLLAWLIFTALLMVKGEHGSTSAHAVSVPKDKIGSFWILEPPDKKRMNIILRGSLIPEYYGNLSRHWLRLWVELVKTDSPDMSEKHIIHKEKITDTWIVPILSENLIDFVPEVTRSTTLDFFEVKKSLISQSIMRIQMETNLKKSFPISLTYDLSPIDPSLGILYATAVLIGLYILIIFELIHRTVAAMMASTMSVAVLAAMDERPSTLELMTWVDVETLILLFSMMVLVAIISDTGIFDYLAVYSYKITNGRFWPLLDTLCIITALLSSFLDNVTTVLLMTPVTIRLCEVMELNPVPILTAMIIFSNIGGALTPVGDPPNVIIATNKDVIESGVTFGTFVLHMGVGLVLVLICVRFHLKFMYRNLTKLKFQEPQGVPELKHEIAIWKRAAGSLSSYSKDEDRVKLTLLKKVQNLLADLKSKDSTADKASSQHYEHTLKEMQEKYPIKNISLLIKSGITLTFVITLFFLHSVPQLNLSLAWSALLGVLLLLILARSEMENILARVEWSTLIFFTALFILIGALTRLGLIDWIGHQTEWLILQVDEKGRLPIAVLLVLWVSAIAAAFVDNIPLTTMMVKIVTSLSKNQELNLPLQPLIWALSFGACLGGNGTLIGASANLVCAGVAEQHGYKFTFNEYLRIGLPVMIGSVCVASVYLLLAHGVFNWNY